MILAWCPFVLDVKYGEHQSSSDTTFTVLPQFYPSIMDLLWCQIIYQIPNINTHILIIIKFLYVAYYVVDIRIED